jgi:hypothetical protein
VRPDGRPDLGSGLPAPVLRSAKLVWWALLASLGIYAVLPFTEALGGSPPPAAAPALVPALGLVAAGLATLTLVIRRRWLEQPLRRGDLDLATAAGAQRFLTTCLLTWVLSESIGIYGLVLFFLTRDRRPLLSFVAAAALLLLHHRPGRPLPERDLRPGEPPRP